MAHHQPLDADPPVQRRQPQRRLHNRRLRQRNLGTPLPGQGATDTPQTTNGAGELRQWNTNTPALAAYAPGDTGVWATLPAQLQAALDQLAAWTAALRNALNAATIPGYVDPGAP